MTGYSPSSTRRDCSAFTWIELLVVISIIALLVGILLPAVNTGCRASDSAIDQSHLRQIGVAFLSYAAEHDQLLPNHPRLVDDYIGDPAWRDEVFVNPYQDEDAVLDHAEATGPVLRYGGYVYLNLGSRLDEIETPKDLILAYTAKVSDKQKTRSVLFADSHTEQWTEEQLREALPPDVDVDALDGP